MSSRAVEDKPELLLNELKEHKRHNVSFALFSHDGTFLVSGGSDRALSVFDTTLLATKTPL